MNKTNTPTEAGFLRDFLGSLKTSVIATFVLAIIVSGIYPLVVWGLAQVLFHNKANGSLIDKDGQPTSKDEDAVGSALLAQGFAKPEYFHPRPSQNNYDGTSSSGSNLGPTSAKLLFGTTKDGPFTVIAYDSSHASAANPAGRIEGTFVSSTPTTITIAIAPASGATAAKSTYPLDPKVAITAQGRTLSATTPAANANVELKFNTATPPAVTAVTVIDKVVEGTVSAVNKDTSKITVPGDGGSSTDYAIPSSATLIVNGNATTQIGDVPVGAHVRIVIATVMDFDGIADRVVHYCEDNNISYTSSIPLTTFKDADGPDDVKLIAAFNAANGSGGTPPTITPDAKTPIPADAVTASGSGLDPHISVSNADLQAARVALARTKDGDKASDQERARVLGKVKTLISQYTEGPNLGFLGEAGVNVLRLNIALDKEAPVPPAAPATAPATAPTTAPATQS